MYALHFVRQFCQIAKQCITTNIIFHAQLCFAFIALSLTIGFQQGYYSTREGNDLLRMCVEVVSGDIAGRSVSLNYTTIDGSAEGMCRSSMRDILVHSYYTIHPINNHETHSILFYVIL